MATITGNAGTVINATCTVSDDGQDIDETESAATAQSICDDLATIKSGNCTISGTKTFSGTIAVPNGASIAVASGGAISMASGSTLHAITTLDATSVITAASGSKVTGILLFDASSIASFRGWTRLQDLEDLTDADHTISATGNNQRLRMLTNPAATRTIRVSETNAVAGDWFELTVLLGSGGSPVQIERFNNPGTAIALLTITATGSPVLNNVGSVRIQFDGTNWRGSFAGMCCLYGGDW